MKGIFKKQLVFTLASIFILTTHLFAQIRSEAIIGRWRSDKGNLVFRIYKHNNEYFGKIVSIKGTDDNSLDDKNPSDALKSRKIIGLDVISHLRFDPDEGKWVDGTVYDLSSGKTYEAIAWVTDDNDVLHIKGFWGVKIFSKTKTFRRVE